MLVWHSDNGKIFAPGWIIAPTFDQFGLYREGNGVTHTVVGTIDKCKRYAEYLDTATTRRFNPLTDRIQVRTSRDKVTDTYRYCLTATEYHAGNPVRSYVLVHWEGSHKWASQARKTGQQIRADFLDAVNSAS